MSDSTLQAKGNAIYPETATDLSAAIGKLITFTAGAPAVSDSEMAGKLRGSAAADSSPKHQETVPPASLRSLLIGPSTGGAGTRRCNNPSNVSKSNGSSKVESARCSSSSNQLVSVKNGKWPNASGTSKASVKGK